MASSAVVTPVTVVHGASRACGRARIVTARMPCNDRPRDGEPLTELLLRAANGEEDAAQTVLPLVYRELRTLAQARMAGERRDHTLQATALVHETWLKMVGVGEPNWADRHAFYRAAAVAMRRILVDHARSRGRDKRGGGQRKVPLDAVQLATVADADDVLCMDEAIVALEQRDPRLAEQVKLRFYAGLDETEVAAALQVSERTTRRDWVLARAFLQRHFGDA